MKDTAEDDVSLCSVSGLHTWRLILYSSAPAAETARHFFQSHARSMALGKGIDWNGYGDGKLWITVEQVMFFQKMGIVDKKNAGGKTG